MINSLLSTYLFIEGVLVGCVCYMVTYDVQVLYNTNAKFVMLWYLAWCVVANLIFSNKIFKFDSKYYNSQSWKFVLFISSLLFPACLLFVRGILSTLIVVTVIAFMTKLCQKVITLLENKEGQLTNVEYIAFVIGIVLSGVLVRAFVFGIFGKIVLLAVYALIVLLVIYLDALELLLHTEDSWLRYSISSSFSLTKTIYDYCAMLSFRNAYRLVCNCFHSLGCRWLMITASNQLFGGRLRNSVSGTSLDDPEEIDGLLALETSGNGSSMATAAEVGMVLTPTASEQPSRVVSPTPGTAVVACLELAPDLPPMSARYMRGCNNNAEEAKRRWEFTYRWRVDNNIDALLAYSDSTKHILTKIPDIKSCYPHFFHGTSKSGSPVYYEKLGSINIKKLMGDHRISIDMLLKYNIFMQEYVWRKLEPDDDAGKMITVLDVSGIKMSDMMGDTLEYIKKSVQVIQAHYVDRCLKMYIVNAPFYFNMLWQVVSPLLNETTRNKVTIVSTSQREITSNLTSYIDSDQLPLEYSGGNKNSLPLGKHPNELAYMAFVTEVLENKAVPEIHTESDTRNSGGGGGSPSSPCESLPKGEEQSDCAMMAVELGDAGDSFATPSRTSGEPEPFQTLLRPTTGLFAATNSDSEEDEEDNEFFEAAKTWLGGALETAAALPVGTLLQRVQSGYSNFVVASQELVQNNDMSSIGDSLTQTGDVLTRSVTKTIKQAYLGKKNSYYFDKAKQQWVFEDDGAGAGSDSDSESSGCESSDESSEETDEDGGSPEASPHAKHLRKTLYTADSSDEESNISGGGSSRLSRPKKTSPRKHAHGSPLVAGRKAAIDRQHSVAESSISTEMPKKRRRDDNILSVLYSLGMILLDYTKISTLNGWLWARKHLIMFLQSKYLLTCCKDFGYSIQFCVTNGELLSFYMLWTMILTCCVLHLPMFLYADRAQFGFHTSTTNTCRIIVSSGVFAIGLLLYGGNVLEGDASGAYASYQTKSGVKPTSTLNQLLLHLRGLRAAAVVHICVLAGVGMIILQSFDNSASYAGWMMQGAVVMAATTAGICVSILYRLGVRAMLVKLTAKAPATFRDADTGRSISAPTHGELEGLIHVLMDVAAFAGVLIGVIWNPIHIFVYIISGNGGGAAAAVTMASPFMACIAGYVWLYQRSIDLPHAVRKQNLLEIV